MRALEVEEFERLGNQADIRSNLSSYARFLGIDPLPIVGEFEARHGEAPSAIEELDRRVRAARRPQRPKWVVASVVSAAILAAAGVVGLLGGSAERPAEVPTVAPAPAEPDVVPASEARVRIRIQALTETTIGVIADGRQVFEGTLGARSSRSFRARDEVELVVADAGAVRVTHNGSELGAPGPTGETFRGRYGPDGRIRG